MRVIRVSELKGKTVKDVISLSPVCMAISTVDNMVGVITACGEVDYIRDDYRQHRSAHVHGLLKAAGLTTDEELAAEILAETHAEDLLQYNALKAKLGL